ncbi:MAG TPA: type II toxin-antitoxin system HicA family toxin [Thermoanaerobaculia bacterium]|nr:type II toxin-antitoxin system HicA family toxin [Thermoanaerobaculia bacterium]
MIAHGSVYTLLVKRRDLEQRLSECGWRFLRRGGRHVWTDGNREEAIPRHREINENLARSILQRACGRKL